MDLPFSRSGTASTLLDEAIRINLAVRDDPEGRCRLRKEFYRKWGGNQKSEFGFGTAEIAFLMWEISRGAFNAPSNASPGSPWWRNVNEEFNVLSTWAELLHEAEHDGHDTPHAVQCWLAYLRKPSPENWYRAHNASILGGYLKYLDLAQEEAPGERAFVNVVLYRVLFAESMVQKAGIGLGRWSAKLATPCSQSVTMLVHLPSVYPATYPLSADDQVRMRRDIHPDILSASNGVLRDRTEEEDGAAAEVSFLGGLVNAGLYLVLCLVGPRLVQFRMVGLLFERMIQFVMDRVLILPHIAELYGQASAWLEEPRLRSLLHSSCPCYAVPRRAFAAAAGTHSDDHGRHPQ